MRLGRSRIWAEGEVGELPWKLWVPNVAHLASKWGLEWQDVGRRVEAALSPVPAPASRLSGPRGLGWPSWGCLDLAPFYLPLIEEEEQRKS